LKFINLQEKGNTRIYNFINIIEDSSSMIHRQLENRNGKIFMRAKRRSVIGER